MPPFDGALAAAQPARQLGGALASHRAFVEGQRRGETFDLRYGNRRHNERAVVEATERRRFRRTARREVVVGSSVDKAKLQTTVTSGRRCADDRRFVIINPRIVTPELVLAKLVVPFYVRVAYELL